MFERQADRWWVAARLGCVLLVSIGLASCDRGAQERPITYRGKYHIAMQEGLFTQAGVDACMFIEWAMPSQEVPMDVDDVIVVQGFLSKPGKYGKAGCLYKLTNTAYLGRVQTPDN
jgi:hypothetical protein